MQTSWSAVAAPKTAHIPALWIQFPESWYSWGCSGLWCRWRLFLQVGQQIRVEIVFTFNLYHSASSPFLIYHRCIAEVVCNDPSQHIAMRAYIHNFIKNIWDAPLGKTSLCPVWGMFVNSYVKHGGELPQNTALTLLEYYDATGCICWFHNFHSPSCLTTPLLSFFFIISCVNSGR